MNATDQCSCGHVRSVHNGGRGSCNASVAGYRGGSPCVCSRFRKDGTKPRPSPRYLTIEEELARVEKEEALRESQEARDALALAHTINAGSTEEGAAIRAHLITMGWRAP